MNKNIYLNNNKNILMCQKEVNKHLGLFQLNGLQEIPVIASEFFATDQFSFILLDIITDSICFRYIFLLLLMKCILEEIYL